MSTPVVANSEREQIQLKAQRARATRTSRHNISKRALEHLHREIGEQQDANERTKLAEHDHVRAEHLAKTIELDVQFTEEISELEIARLAIIADFDAQCEVLERSESAVNAALATTMLEEEGQRHANMLEYLRIKNTVEDRKANQTLQKHLWKLQLMQEKATAAVEKIAVTDAERSNDAISEVIRCTREIENASELAQVRRNEHKQAYEQLVGRHITEWKLREAELRCQIDDSEWHHARLKLEDTLQHQLSDHNQRLEALHQRQSEKVIAQKKRYDFALAAVQEAYERAEAALIEERQEVDEWWQYHCNEAAECRLRDDEEESRSIDRMDGREAAAVAEAAAGRGAEVEMMSSGVPAHPQEEKKGEAEQAGLVAGARGSATATPVRGLYREDTSSAESRETTQSLSIVTSVADNDPTPRFDGTAPVRVVLAHTSEDQAVTSSNTPSASTNEPGRPPPSTEPVVRRAESYDTGGDPFGYAKPKMANGAQWRSSSPDSIGSSDFVEI